MLEAVQGRVHATSPRRVKWGYGYFPSLVAAVWLMVRSGRLQVKQAFDAA